MKYDLFVSVYFCLPALLQSKLPVTPVSVITYMEFQYNQSQDTAAVSGIHYILLETLYFETSLKSHQAKDCEKSS